MVKLVIGKSEERQRKRKRMLAAHGYSCWYCGIDLHMREIQLDHIVPQASGGVDAITNMAISCSFCNGGKSGKTLDEFYAWMKWVSGREFKPKINPDEPHPMDKNYGPKMPGF